MASLDVDPSERAANGRSTRDNTTSGICPSAACAGARPARASSRGPRREGRSRSFRISPRTCANEEAGAVVFSLVDDDATDDLPDKQGDLARGFTRANAFYVGNEALEKLDVVRQDVRGAIQARRRGDVRQERDIVDSTSRTRVRRRRSGRRRRPSGRLPAGDHSPNGAFHVAAPGRGLLETAPAIARGEDGTAWASANWFVAGRGSRSGAAARPTSSSTRQARARARGRSSGIRSTSSSTRPIRRDSSRGGSGSETICARGTARRAPPSPPPRRPMGAVEYFSTVRVRALGWRRHQVLGV